MPNIVDRFLNNITMYRLMLYYLIGLLGVSVIFGFLGILPYSPVSLAFSAFVLVLVSWAVNTLFAWAFDVQTNVESVYITALILVLIITPVSLGGAGIAFLVWAGILATASKYILAVRKKHVFNPAALAVAITAFTLGQYASWWVAGNVPLLFFVLVGGLLVARKIRRFDLVVSFLISALAAVVASGFISGSSAFSGGFWGGVLAMLGSALVHSPLFFFAFVMITEPLTMPPTRVFRICYGVLAGLLFAPGVHLGSIYSTPELALLMANLFSFAVSPKGKYLLTLKSKKEIGRGIVDFVFLPDRPLHFRAGQYFEWTLGHEKPDSRGNRRYFTIASSPTEKEIHAGVRISPESSSFKTRLLKLESGDKIIAGQLAGDFVLPKDVQEKGPQHFVFIAGGIGVTPFRSMVKYLIDTHEHAGGAPVTPSIVLMYANRTPEEIVYRDVFDTASEHIHFKAVYVLTDLPHIPADWKGERGYINEEMIKRQVPDWSTSTFYVSGPHSMVVATEDVLRDMGIGRDRIKTDFFPGFA